MSHLLFCHQFLFALLFTDDMVQVPEAHLKRNLHFVINLNSTLQTAVLIHNLHTLE